jgi:hypothetical protein
MSAKKQAPKSRANAKKSAVKSPAKKAPAKAPAKKSPAKKKAAAPRIRTPEARPYRTSCGHRPPGMPYSCALEPHGRDVPHQGDGMRWGGGIRGIQPAGES